MRGHSTKQVSFVAVGPEQRPRVACDPRHQGAGGRGADETLPEVRRDVWQDGAAFDASTFAKNKDRILNADVSRLAFEGVMTTARRNRLSSPDHVSDDSTLIEAWASLRSVRPRDEYPSQRPPPDGPGNPTVDGRGEKRTNATHASKPAHSCAAFASCA